MKITAVSVLFAAACFLAAAASGGPVQAEIAEMLTSLVNAERAFSRASETAGIREAFLAWLAPDAVVFRPQPVAGRPLYEKMAPGGPAILTWEPEVAEIAASGELGYTSGPYQIRPGQGAEPSEFGHYVSVWKKQADGTWKVLLDIGISHDRQTPALAAPDLGTHGTGASRLPPEALREEELVFARRSASFEKEASSNGLRNALAAFAADDIRVLRPGRVPAIGKTALEQAVLAEAGRVVPDSGKGLPGPRTVMGWSGDLAVSYGTFGVRTGRPDVETRSYLRIWRRRSSSAWRICLDIELPVPAGGGK